MRAPVRRSTTEARLNGDKISVSWRWVAGVFALVLMALIGGWAGTVQLRLTALETATARIAAVETRMQNIEDKHDEIRSMIRELFVSQKSVENALAQHRLNGGERVIQPHK